MFKRDARKQMDVFRDLLRGSVKPRPKLVPKFVWRILTKLVIKLD